MKSPFKVLLIAVVNTFFISTSNADNTLIENDTAYLSASVMFQTAFFAQSNSWFGNAKDHIGVDSGSWWEGTVEPGLKGHFNLSAGSQLYYELSYLYGQTIDDDASGLTLGLNNPGEGRLEQAYMGWRSGDMFSLGNNFLDISLGQQDFKLGHGFLIWGGGSPGYKYGAWWLGTRHAFTDSGMLKMNTGAIKAEAFRLRSRPQNGCAKDIRGINFEYQPNKDYTLGGTYLRVNQNGNSSIDGADILDFRLDINTISVLPGFSFLAEYVKEDNGKALDSHGWYSNFAWQFESVSWQPQLIYRYTGLQGDDPDTVDNEAFNPLHYGFPDWGTWFQGEIIGEYVLGNSNLNSHLLRLKAKPSSNLSLNLLCYRFQSDKPKSRGITSKHFADEIDIIVDWPVNKSFSISGVFAVAIPGDGAKEMTGGDDNWILGMLYSYYRF